MSDQKDNIMNEDELPKHQQHDFDGIVELDNDLPRWWLGIFWVTILFALFYVPYYHFINPEKLPRAKHAAEVAALDAKRAEAKADRAERIEESAGGDTLAERYAAGGWQADGKQTFDTYCMPCHATDGGGGIGPNFTDDYYIHGGKIEDFIRIINEGVPEKGMVSWKALLKPEQIEHVAFYIRSMRGTTPAQPKEPQGRKVDEQGAFIEAEEPVEPESQEGE